MNRAIASGMLRKELDKHGLDNVRAVINPRLTSTFGRYRWGLMYGKGIELSGKLVDINDESVVQRVIYHEVAHALTEGHKHDAVWKAKCLELGGDGEQYYSSANANTIERTRSSKLYTLRCDDCGFQGGRYKRRMSGYRHRGCGGNLTNIELR